MIEWHLFELQWGVRVAGLRQEFIEWHTVNEVDRELWKKENRADLFGI